MLLAGILAALIVLSGITAAQPVGNGSGPSGPCRDQSVSVVAEGQTARHQELSHPSPGPRPIGDPSRFETALQVGRAGPGL